MAKAPKQKSKPTNEIVEPAARTRESAAETPEAEPTSTSIHASFRRDAAVREALTSHLQALGARSREIAERARVAFRKFDTNQLSHAEPPPPSPQQRRAM